MNRIFLGLTLAGMLMVFGILYGQTADCRKKCKEELKNCTSGCTTMDADTAGCGERCGRENSGCLSKCGTTGTDAATVDNDADDLDNEADYTDDSLDDDSEYED